MKVHDEVCGMEIKIQHAEATVDFQGKTYHFCAERCARKFREHPDWYVPVRPETVWGPALPDPGASLSSRNARPTFASGPRGLLNPLSADTVIGRKAVHDHTRRELRHFKEKLEAPETDHL